MTEKNNGFNNCVQEARPFLLVAETQYAVAVCAERTREDLQIADDDLKEIWLIERQGIGSADFATTDVAEDGLLTCLRNSTNDDISTYQRLGAKVIEVLDINLAQSHFPYLHISADI